MKLINRTLLDRFSGSNKGISDTIQSVSVRAGGFWVLQDDQADTIAKANGFDDGDSLVTAIRSARPKVSNP